MKRFLILIFLSISLFSYGSQADLIVFSYDRPLQLFALLESVSKFVSNLNQTHVLYRVSSSEISGAYAQIQQLYPQIHWVKQGAIPRQDFKPLLVDCFLNSPSEYVLFAVDDDIVKDYVDIQNCIDALEKTNAYCFFLRLGNNITQGYTYEYYHFTTPKCTEIVKDVFQYYFNDGMTADWRYPNNVDMTLYSKSKIQNFVLSSSYSSPNTFEQRWSENINFDDYGLFFNVSKMFSLPVNIVQEDWTTPCEYTFTAKELFQFWQEGLIMDLEPYYFLRNTAPFVAKKPTFKRR